MVKEGSLFINKPPAERSAALAIQEKVPKSTKVVAAIHHVPAGKLKDVVKCKSVYDAIICSDDAEAKKLSWNSRSTWDALNLWVRAS